ncbi:MAG: metallophosphoesterase family protein [Pseudomonadota bacterium]
MFSQKKKAGRPPRGKANERAYAIGDVHGCLNETKTLLSKIKAHNDYLHETKTYLIFLGDIIDRGPDSKGVIELLMDLPIDFVTPLFIMGNHEEMAVRGLMGEPHLIRKWLEYGGYAFADSYGVSRAELLGQSDVALEHILRSAVPKSHVEFLSEFLELVVFGDFLFTHAGIRPGIPVDKQDARDLRWIREPFLEYSGDHGFVVVHGHTVSTEVVRKANRIGLDTGAYESGRLSAMYVEDGLVSFLST